MMRSLFAGISGLRNFQVKMDIIGNNIANVSTVGFKGSRINFAETMAHTISGEVAPRGGRGGINAMQVGLGMRALSIDSDFTQGSLDSTGIVTDLAIQGEGFFVLSDNENLFYTRAGAFNVDADGSLVAAGSGNRVMGYLAIEGTGGDLDRSRPQPISIPLGRRAEARSTTDVILSGNLDMNMTKSDVSLIDAGDTGIVDVSGTARDGVGGLHTVRITGENATASTGAGATQGLNLTDTFEAHGITSFDGFGLRIDGDRFTELAGLTAESNISDLINAINAQVFGASASINEDGSIQISRDHHGAGERFTVELIDPEGAGENGVVGALFGSNLEGVEGTFIVNNGTRSTLNAVDDFAPEGQNRVIQNVLEMVVDERTGLITGISNIGGAGIFINAPSGLQSGIATLNTDVTDHSTSILVYDSLGNTHNLTTTFTRSEITGMWRWNVSVPEPAVAIDGATGEISFRDDGSLESFRFNDNVTEFSFNPGNGAQNVHVGFNTGSFGSFDGLTQTASPTNTLASGQDGYGLGVLNGVYVDVNGSVFGNFSNGVTENLAQILIANFTNPQGLTRIGGSMYRQTVNSGSPRVSEAENAGATINSGFLEMSNVDLSQQFTEMILAQRAFQATARVITTSDGLLEEVTRLKR